MSTPPSSSTWKEGDYVDVESRMYIGINQEGGRAQISKINPDGTVNVKYILRQGRESNLKQSLLSKPEEIERPSRRKRREVPAAKIEQHQVKPKTIKTKKKMGAEDSRLESAPDVIHKTTVRKKETSPVKVSKDKRKPKSSSKKKEPTTEVKTKPKDEQKTKPPKSKVDPKSNSKNERKNTENMEKKKTKPAKSTIESEPILTNESTSKRKRAKSTSRENRESAAAISESKKLEIKNEGIPTLPSVIETDSRPDIGGDNKRKRRKRRRSKSKSKDSKTSVDAKAALDSSEIIDKPQSCVESEASAKSCEAKSEQEKPAGDDTASNETKSKNSDKKPPATPAKSDTDPTVVTPETKEKDPSADVPEISLVPHPVSPADSSARRQDEPVSSGTRPEEKSKSTDSSTPHNRVQLKDVFHSEARRAKDFVDSVVDQDADMEAFCTAFHSARKSLEEEDGVIDLDRLRGQVANVDKFIPILVEQGKVMESDGRLYMLDD